MSLRRSEVIRFDLPARFTYLHMLGYCIADMLRLVEGMEDAEMLAYSVQLAAHEVCTNIITHAYSGTQSSENRVDVELALHLEPLRFEIKLRDTGHVFDPIRIPAPNLNETQIHGYGLFLINSLMDTVDYTPSEQYNYWRLIKYL